MTWVRQAQTVTALETQEDRFKLFVVTLIAFLCVLPVIFLSVGGFEFRSYFVLGFVWFLITSEVFAPSEPETVWWRRLTWIKAVGWVVFVYLLIERVAAVV